jgi:hypothetical protein
MQMAKRIGIVGKDSNGTTYVTSGSKGDVKNAMVFTNNPGHFKSDVGKQNINGIKDTSTNVNQNQNGGSGSSLWGGSPFPLIGALAAEKSIMFNLLYKCGHSNYTCSI